MSTSGGLASFRPSTGTRPPHHCGAHRLGAPYSSHRAPQRVALCPSLAAALLPVFLSTLSPIPFGLQPVPSRLTLQKPLWYRSTSLYSRS